MQRLSFGFVEDTSRFLNTCVNMKTKLKELAFGKWPFVKGSPSTSQSISVEC